MKRFKTLEELESGAPEIEGMGKMAFYGARCAWWTTDVSRDASTRRTIPTCPLCGSVLYQAKLSPFLNQARKNASHYGPLGIDGLALAHHENNPTDCRAFPTEVPNDHN